RRAGRPRSASGRGDAPPPRSSDPCSRLPRRPASFRHFHSWRLLVIVKGVSLPGRFLNIGGQRGFYHRTGRGRPLVLLHGYPVSHWTRRPVIPQLPRGHPVTPPDLLGFGESDRPPASDFRYDAAAQMETVLAALDALGIESATLLGHSMGGAIALYTAARRPERVDRLIVVDALTYPYRVPLEGQVIM